MHLRQHLPSPLLSSWIQSAKPGLSVFADSFSLHAMSEPGHDPHTGTNSVDTPPGAHTTTGQPPRALHVPPSKPLPQPPQPQSPSRTLPARANHSPLSPPPLPAPAPNAEATALRPLPPLPTAQAPAPPLPPSPHSASAPALRRPLPPPPVAAPSRPVTVVVAQQPSDRQRRSVRPRRCLQGAGAARGRHCCTALA